MASELEFRYPYTGSAPTIYVTIRNTSGQFWRTDTHVFENLNTANYADYGLDLIEQDAPSGWFYANWPSQIGSGKYMIVASLQASSSPAYTDTTVGTLDANWSGSALLSDYDIYNKIASSQTVYVIAPVPDSSGSFTMFQGYDYTVESGTPIGPISLSSSITLTGATLTIWNPDSQSALPFTVDLLSEVGDAKTLQFEITAANTLTLGLGAKAYQLRVRLENGTFPSPLIDSSFQVTT